jgi:hypothetical protein|tara:strand:+ start:41 stop:496 length:456 start_codon:yes stop_codon:yes gene_type:complete
MFEYSIVSTTQISDSSEKITEGDVLYQSNGEEYMTEHDAQKAAEAVLIGLDGGKAFNRALESAEIEVIERDITEEGYLYGIEIGYQTIESISKKENLYEMKDMFGGLFTALFHSAYYVAPSEQAFDQLIDFAKICAKKDKEKAEGINNVQH